jgi:malonyl-CoA O-methyltransferase
MVAFNKETVQQSFDEVSKHYDQYTSMQRTIGNRLLAFQQQEPLGNVLDIGAGTGYLTRKLSQFQRVESLYALDIALGMLIQTGQHMASRELNGSICADAESLAIKDKSLSAVYSNVAYQWCSNLSLAFKEAFRVLKKDGAFVFSTFGPNTLRELKTSWSVADDAVHVNEFVVIDEIKKALELAEFRNVRVVSEDIVMYYESPKELMLSLKGMGAHNINQGRNRGLTGVTAYKTMLNDYERLRSKKGIPATFQAVYVEARR